jgi:hypothetical protein
MSTTTYQERSLQDDLTIDLGDNDSLENQYFETNGYELKISAPGSDWEIRNVGVIGEPDTFGSVIDPMVRNDPDGTGLIENVYIERITNNFLFVNRHHEGHLTLRNVTAIDNIYPPEDKEDFLYNSSPGNPYDDGRVKPIGWGGTTDAIGCYVKDIGGYGIRMGTPGSRVIDCTIVGDINKAMSNNFGGEYAGYRGGGDGFPGEVLFQDCDIGGDGSIVQTGLQVGPHQDDHQREMDYRTLTRIENCRVDVVDRPLLANTTYGPDGSGNYPPVVNGIEITEREPSLSDVPGMSGNPDPTPPDGAPMSAREAAQGGADRSVIRLTYNEAN